MGGLSMEGIRQRVHRDYNQEVQNLEVVALCLVDFPDAPWEFKMNMARQAWDEAGVGEGHRGRAAFRVLWAGLRLDDLE